VLISMEFVPPGRNSAEGPIANAPLGLLVVTDTVEIPARG
jgi:hypothetical protein